MTETPFFFNAGDAQLFGMLHAPMGAVGTAFVLSHPFAEEKLWSHRVFVSFARALARRGCAVLRFDYVGAGDSSGGTHEASLNAYLANLAAAAAVLREKHPGAEKLGIIGLRFGATLAALYAESDRALSDGPLVLWDPVMDGQTYFRDLLRSNLSTQMAVYGKVLENRDALEARIRAGGAVSVDGYEIGAAVYESCGRADLLDAQPRRRSGPTLVVQIAPSESAPERPDLRALASSYSTAAFERVIEQPFWREIRAFYGQAENLQSTTIKWLEHCGVIS